MNLHHFENDEDSWWFHVKRMPGCGWIGVCILNVTVTNGNLNLPSFHPFAFGGMCGGCGNGCEGYSLFSHVPWAECWCGYRWWDALPTTVLPLLSPQVPPCNPHCMRGGSASCGHSFRYIHVGEKCLLGVLKAPCVQDFTTWYWLLTKNKNTSFGGKPPPSLLGAK